MEEPLKRCNTCGIEKPLTEYHKRNKSPDGLQYKCKDCYREHAKANYAKNREHRREYARRYHEIAREYKNMLYRRWTADPKNRLRKGIARTMRSVLHGEKNERHWEELVGYTRDELVAHLESLFTEGMSWDNYGEWHVDHVIPQSWFDFETTDDPSFRECWALSNLQPMWARDNIAKGNRYSGGVAC